MGKMRHLSEVTLKICVWVRNWTLLSLCFGFVSGILNGSRKTNQTILNWCMVWNVSVVCTTSVLLKFWNLRHQRGRVRKDTEQSLCRLLKSCSVKNFITMFYSKFSKSSLLNTYIFCVLLYFPSVWITVCSSVIQYLLSRTHFFSVWVRKRRFFF